MAQFKSLSSAISSKMIEFQNKIQNAVTVRTSTGVELGVINIIDEKIEEEKDVLRWGYSTWGIEKVTTEYKPK
jgi:hypothetical protein